MTVTGLPLHPLIVHATVVALPVLALMSLAYLRPRWRDGLRWPLVGMGVVSAALMWLTSASGDSLKRDRFSAVGGEFARRIQHHEDLAGKLAVATYLLAALAVVVPLVRHRLSAPLVWVGAVLLVAGAVGVSVLVVLTGHAGAEAAWAQ
jgi:uncharacterized membrane protein